MLAKKIICTIQELTWTTPTMLSVRFTTNRPFKFLPGQFISIQIPGALKGSKATKRLYSLVSSPEEAKETGIYELCVKYVPGGMGSEFLARSTKGDTFPAYAPYGDFFFRPNSSHGAIFIGTGSGVAPIRSMVLSQEFQDHRPRKSLCLLGVRTEKEKIFVDDFRRSGVETVFAVSNPTAGYAGFKGRVTDYLNKVAGSWDFQATEFYLCGNGVMISDIERILRSNGVPPQQIHREAFSSHNGQYAPRKIVPLRQPGPSTQERPAAVTDLTEWAKHKKKTG